MIRKLLIAALAAISVASAANASTISYSMVPTSATTWSLTASTSIGDNFGLDYYVVPLTGASTINHANVSPRLFDFDAGLSYGFGFARSPDNQSTISAAQDSTGGGYPVYGLGQTVGTLKSLIPAGDTSGGGKPDSVGTYAAPIVLATGTNPTNAWPVIGATATGFVFTSKGSG
jgi:hypothetical protein